MIESEGLDSDKLENNNLYAWMNDEDMLFGYDKLNVHNLKMLLPTFSRIVALRLKALPSNKRMMVKLKLG